MLPQLSFDFYLHGIPFFHPLTFSLYVSLDLKWVSYKQHICGSCFCIIQPSCIFWWKLLVQLYLRQLPIFMFLPLFCKLFWIWFVAPPHLPLSSPLVLFSCDLMTIFSVMRGFFFLFCLSRHLLLLLDLSLSRGFCIAIYIYMIVLSCLSLTFKCISKTLHVYSPPPHDYCFW